MLTKEQDATCFRRVQKLIVSDFYEYGKLVGRILRVSKNNARKGIEEELKECGYTSLGKLGSQWLMLPGIRGYAYDVVIDIPIYFLPISIDLMGNEVIFKAICHRALARKLKLRITLRRTPEGGYGPIARVPVENYMCAFSEPSEELGEVSVKQPLVSSLRKEGMVECVVASSARTSRGGAVATTPTEPTSDVGWA